MQTNIPESTSQETFAAPRPVTVRFPMVQPIVTYAIIAVLVMVHVYANSLSSLDSYDFYLKYSNYADFVVRGEYYRLFTSMFLHAPGLMHLGFNSFALYAFGKDIEGLFGHVRYALIYFLGGLAGSVTSFAITQSNSIGASGAVFAVFGALVAYYYQNRELYGETANHRLRQLGTLAIINLVIGIISNVPGSPARIDNAAHIGGAIGGLILAWFMTPIFRVTVGYTDGQPTPQLIDTRNSPQWIAAPAIFAAVMAVITVVLVNMRAG